MNRSGFIVSARTKRQIYDIAAALRSVFCQAMNGPYVRVEVIYEMLHLVLPAFRFEVCSHQEMGTDHGRTYPERLLIELREDVYDGMCRGNGRDRFTGGHELGHLFLHRDASYGRSFDEKALVYRNSEWQANAFSSALLIDEKWLSDCTSVLDVQRRFGVSEPAALARFKK